MMLLLLLFTLTQSTGIKDEPAKPKLVEELESMAEHAADVAAPAVVAITIEREAPKKEQPAPQGPGRNNPSRNLLRGGGVFENRPEGCAVSGTIVDSSGLILTSYFNVDGKIKKITVQLPNGESKEAELVGFHSPLDIALLRVQAKGLATLTPAEPKKVGVGLPVYALGRSPEGNHLTLNAGIVSALGRFGGRILQHDGETNYGNAGGPLVDAQGRLVGITCKIHTKYAALYGQNSGLGFAAPWDKISEVLAQLKQGAKIDAEKRAYVGVQSDTNSTAKGAAVSTVQPGTPAEKAGLKNGDVIVEFDGVRLDTWDDFTREVTKKKPGDKVKLKVKRGDKEIEYELVLGERVVD
jgi:S1-C subfamily serine protease